MASLSSTSDKKTGIADITHSNEVNLTARKEYLTELFRGWIRNAGDPGHWIRPVDLPRMMSFAHCRLGMPRSEVLAYLKTCSLEGELKHLAPKKATKKATKNTPADIGKELRAVYNTIVKGHIYFSEALPNFRMAAQDPAMQDAKLRQLLRQYDIPADMFFDQREDEEDADPTSKRRRSIGSDGTRESKKGTSERARRSLEQDVEMRDAPPTNSNSNQEATGPTNPGAKGSNDGPARDQVDLDVLLSKVISVADDILSRPRRTNNMFSAFSLNSNTLPSSRTRMSDPDFGQEVKEALKRPRRRKDANLVRKPTSYLRQTHASSGTGSGRATSTAGLSKLFDKYRDDPQNSPDTLTITPTIAYLNALTLLLDEPAVLAFLTILAAPAMGELTRDGFIAGWRSLSPPNQIADTIAKQIPLAQGLRQSLQVDRELWHKVYRHTFILARQPGQRAVGLDVAVEYWRLLFGQGGWQWRSERKEEDDEGPGVAETPWLEWYIEYLEANWKKSVNHDLWDQTAKFAKLCVDDPTLNWWSEDGAWPGVLDDFVGFVKARRGG